MIQKSVRIPSSLVYYVNSQLGDDFSKKLVAILVEYRDGDVERRLMLQRYDEQLAERRVRLSRLLDDIGVLSRIHGRVLDLVHEVEFAELLAPDCPGSPEPPPGQPLPFAGLPDDLEMPFV